MRLIHSYSRMNYFGDKDLDQSGCQQGIRTQNISIKEPAKDEEKTILLVYRMRMDGGAPRRKIKRRLQKITLKNCSHLHIQMIWVLYWI